MQKVKKPLSWDTLASTALANVSPEPMVPFLPASKISLSVQGQSITHHVPSAVRRLSITKDQRDYLSFPKCIGNFYGVRWCLILY